MRIGAPLPFDRLLRLCTQPSATRAQHDEIAKEAAAYAAWDALCEAAEDHGISPLVAARLSVPSASSHAPKLVQAQLRALAMRHRRANAIRARLIGELAAAFERQGIPLLFLKGAALAFCEYEAPELRAMRDLDVLVREQDLCAAGALLASLGYVAADESTWAADREHPHHQPPRVRHEGGYAFAVEVHRRLGIADARARRTLDALAPYAAVFRVGDAQARTLGPTDMLAHVHYHGFRTPLAWPDRFRLTSVADVSVLVSAHVDDIDWDRARAQSPRIVESLAWLHALVPFDSRAASRLRLDELGESLELGPDYRGKPRERDYERPDRAQHLRDTWLPPAWWLRVRHGGRRGLIGLAAAWVRHAREVL